MRVAIIGRGPIGLATAAQLQSAGHEVDLLSSRNGDANWSSVIAFDGKISGEYQLSFAGDVKRTVSGAECIIIAVPAGAYKVVLDLIAPVLESRHFVLFLAQYSLAALYLSKHLSARGVRLPIVAWGTTPMQARRTGDTSVQVTTMRSGVDVATVPMDLHHSGLTLARTLFGNVFVSADDLLTITLNNVNAQSHMAFLLSNFTRVELGEQWSINQNYTEKVGFLIQALDEERVRIAAAYGKHVKTRLEHIRNTYGVNAQSGPESRYQIEKMGIRPMGPRSLTHRYFTEDIPYGAAVIHKLGIKVGREPTLYKATIDVLSALCGRNFYSENDLLKEIGFDELSSTDLARLCREGF